MADQQNAYAQNFAARRGLLPGFGSRTVRRRQIIAQGTTAAYVAGQGLTFNVQPAPVGIITKFIIKINATIAQGAAETQTRVRNGAAAILGNVQYIDTSNQTRINCSGAYLNTLAMIRNRGKRTGAYTQDNNGIDGIGANYTAGITAAPASVTTAVPLVQFYEVPLAYSDTDLRGAVLAALINATQTLSFTINPNFFVTSTDTTNIMYAGYQSSTAQLGKITSLTYTVYQEYIDQFANLPLPAIDLGTQYILQETGGFVPVANTDLIIPYANFRVFMSTMLTYNNNGTFNTGSDINYISLRTANQSDLVKMDPYTTAYMARGLFGDDPPAGAYILDHREKPLYTDQYGNLSLVVQASSVGGAASSIMVGYEQLALMSQINASQQVGSGG